MSKRTTPPKQTPNKATRNSQTSSSRTSSSQASGKQSPGINGWIIVGIVAAVVVIAGIVAAVANSGSDSDSGEPNGTAPANLSQTQPVTVTGEPLPEFDDADPDPAIGMQAPVLAGASFDDTPITIGTPGKPTLVIFLAHWCPHCQREVPRLVEWQKSGAVPAGIDIYGVATATTASRPNYPPSAWLENEEFPFPVMADSPDLAAAQAYGLTSYPYFVLLDKDGKVVARDSGELEVAALDDLLATVTA